MIMSMREAGGGEGPFAGDRGYFSIPYSAQSFATWGAASEGVISGWSA
jgi:hypothetical protein